MSGITMAELALSMSYLQPEGTKREAAQRGALVMMAANAYVAGDIDVDEMERIVHRVLRDDLDELVPVRQSQIVKLDPDAV